MREQRKLAAVLAADVVGYSRLMGRDEAGTLARLKEHRAQRFEPALARNGGRLVKLTGDGALAEFGSAVDALRAAIEFQRAVDYANANELEEQRVVFRVGLHLGDMIVDGDDLYGDSVNVAARLEGEAPPGGIIVSGALHEAAAGKLQAQFVDLGRLSLQNIDRQVQAYRVEWDQGISSESLAGDPLPLPNKPSIAVLPFQNMSGDSEQEFFADGMSEDIITELTRFHELFVIARNSSFSYKGKLADIRMVGRELGVRYVLEGSMRKATSRIRVTAQLIDASTGAQIWAERYDRVLADVFDVQEELARNIVRATAPHISASELAKMRRRHTASLSAYEIGVRANATAWEAFVLSDPKLCNEALGFSATALAIDPENTTALAARALAQFQHLVRGTAPDRQVAWDDGMASVERLLALDHESSIAHVRKGLLLMMAPEGSRFDEAMVCARQGYDLNPHDTTSLTGLAWIENLSGHPIRAIELLQEALRVSPRDPMRPHIRQQLTMASFGARRYVEGVDHARLGITEMPTLPPLHAYLAVNLVGLRQYTEAMSAMAVARRTGPELIERLLAGKARSRDAGYVRRVTTFMRVAAGLEEATAAEALR